MRSRFTTRKGRVWYALTTRTQSGRRVAPPAAVAPGATTSIGSAQSGRTSTLTPRLYSPIAGPRLMRCGRNEVCCREDVEGWHRELRTDAGSDHGHRPWRAPTEPG